MGPCTPGLCSLYLDIQLLDSHICTAEVSLEHAAEVASPNWRGIQLQLLELYHADGQRLTHAALPGCHERPLSHTVAAMVRL